MSNVPKARSYVQSALDALQKGDITTAKKFLVEALPLMIREQYFRQPVAPTARKVTPQIAAEVKDYVDKHPNVTFREVGRLFHIDGGRVSEIMNGKKTLK